MSNQARSAVLAAVLVAVPAAGITLIPQQTSSGLPTGISSGSIPDSPAAVSPSPHWISPQTGQSPPAVTTSSRTKTTRVYVTVPGPTVTITVPGPARTIYRYRPGPTVTVVEPGPTVTVTKTVTLSPTATPSP